MSEQMTVGVTGATGFVGRYLVRALLGRGHAVRALVRDPSKARAVLEGHDRLTTVRGDLDDDQAIDSLVDGADACAHLVGIIRESGGGQTFRRVHVGFTRRVVQACERASVRRYLHMSALGVRPDSKAEYQRTKYEAEMLVRDSDLDWTIFRPSVIHGPDGEFVRMVRDMASGQQMPYFFMPYFVRPKLEDRVPFGAVYWVSARVQPVAVLDVAHCFAEALLRPKTVQEIYNLVGDEAMTWPELYRFFRDTLPGSDHRIQMWHVPGTHAAAIANIAKKVGLGSLLPFDAGQALMAMEDSVSELEKARRHLGLGPRPFRQTVRDYAAQV